jgi:uncharacterized protein (DUF2141 family)
LSSDRIVKPIAAQLEEEAVMNVQAVAFAIVLSALGAAPVMAADLTITVKNVRNADGLVRIGLYDSAASFLKPPLAKTREQVKASPGEIKLVLHDLPAGRYAVSSFHDENGSGKVEYGPLGIPIQGFGFSNDAQSTEGPPSFGQAAFDFDGKIDKAISFSLNY